MVKSQFIQHFRGVPCECWQRIQPSDGKQRWDPGQNKGFLAQNEKRTNEICTVIDVCVDSHEADEISAFFCEEMNKRKESNIRFSFEKNGSYVRVILRGYEDAVMEILNAYYN